MLMVLGTWLVHIYHGKIAVMQALLFSDQTGKIVPKNTYFTY